MGIPLDPSTTSVGVHNGYGIRICYGNMIWLDADQRSILLVGGINGEISTASSGVIQKPEVGEAGQWWSRYRTEGPIPDIRPDVEDRCQE